MEKTSTSWVLSFLTGQLNKESITDILRNNKPDLDNVDFTFDDVDDLWKKKTIKESYGDNKQKFIDDYDDLSSLYSKYEVARGLKSVIPQQEEIPKFQHGGGLNLRDASTWEPGQPLIISSSLSHPERISMPLYDPNTIIKSNMNPDFDPYVNIGTTGIDSYSNLRNDYSEGQLAEQFGGFREKNGNLRDVVFSDRFSMGGGSKIVYNEETRKYELANIGPGEDLLRDISSGKTIGGYGLFGAQEKYASESAGGLAAVAGKSFIGNGVWDTFMGTGHGGVTALKAINDFVGSEKLNPFLHALDNQFTNANYTGAENIENADWKSVTGFANIVPSTIGQIVVAMGTGAVLGTLGMSTSQISNTVVGGLTLFGAADFRNAALDAGLNPKTASIVWLGATVALTAVNKQLDYYWKYLSPEERAKISSLFVKEVVSKDAAGLTGGTITPAETTKKFVDKFREGVISFSKSKMWEGLKKEPVQETSEELIGIGAEAAGYHLKNVADLLGIDSKNLYTTGDVSDLGKDEYARNFNWKAISNRLASSAVFGAIGGAVGGIGNIRHKESTESGFAGNIMRYAAKDGADKVNENLDYLQSTADGMYNNKELSSDKVGFNRTGDGASITPITEKNKDQVTSLNDMFYNRISQDIAAVRTTWESSGLNKIKDELSTVLGTFNTFDNYKLYQLEKKFIEEKHKSILTKKLLELQSLDRETEEITKLRDANDTPAEVKMYYDTVLSGKGESKKKKKDKTKGYEASNLESVDKAIEIPKGTSIKERKELLLEQIKDIQSGKYINDIIRDTLLQTESKIKSGTQSANPYENIERVLYDGMGVKSRSLNGYYSINNSMQYSANKNLNEQKSKLYDYLLNANFPEESNRKEYADNNYVEGETIDERLKRLVEVHEARVKPNSNLAIQLIKDNPINSKGLKGISTMELNDEAKNFVITTAEEKIKELATSIENLTKDLDDKEAESIFNGGGSSEEMGSIKNTISQLENEYKDLTESLSTFKVNQSLKPVVGDTKNTLELYLNSVEEIDGTVGKGEDKKEITDLVSSSESLEDLLSKLENSEKQEGENFTDIEGIENLLKNIKRRKAQVHLNSTVIPKTNEIKSNVLDVILGTTDTDLNESDAVKAYRNQQIVKEKIILAKEKGARDAVKLSKEDNTSKKIINGEYNFSELSKEDADFLTEKLNKLNERVSILKEKALKNKPSLDSKSVVDDLVFARNKVDLIDNAVNNMGNGNMEERTAILDLLPGIKTSIGELFEPGTNKLKRENGVVPNTAKVQDGLNAIIKRIVDAEALLSGLLIKNPTIINLFDCPLYAEETKDGILSAYYSKNTINNNDTFVYLTALRNLHPYTFYQLYNDRLEAEKGDESATKIIPSYMQQHAIHQSLALILMEESDSSDPYKLVNQSYIAGIQGSGKSTIVARLTAHLYIDHTIGILKIDPFKDGDDTGVKSIDDLISAGLDPYSIGNTGFFHTVKSDAKGKSKVKYYHPTTISTDNGIDSFKKHLTNLNQKRIKSKKKALKGITDAQIKQLERFRDQGIPFLFVVGIDSFTLVEGSNPDKATNQLPKFDGYSLASDAPSSATKILAMSKFQDLAQNLKESLGGNMANIVQHKETINGDAGAQTLIDMLKATKTPNDLNAYDIIMFDEATLITEKELLEINKLLKEYNENRLSGLKKLKIIYLGDNGQIGEQGALKPGRRPGSKDYGSVLEVPKFRVNRTFELSFTHRSGNRGISTLVDHFRDADEKLGTGYFSEAPVTLVFSKTKEEATGSEIVRQIEKELKIKNFIKAYGDDKRTNIAMGVNNDPEMITDDEIKELSTLYGIPVQRSSALQGKTFDYIIADLEVPNKMLPRSGKSGTFEYANSINEIDLKEQAISLVGRARKYVMFVSSEENLSSIESKNKSGENFAIINKTPEQFKVHKTHINDIIKDKKYSTAPEEELDAEPGPTFDPSWNKVADKKSTSDIKLSFIEEDNNGDKEIYLTVNGEKLNYVLPNSVGTLDIINDIVINEDEDNTFGTSPIDNISDNNTKVLQANIKVDSPYIINLTDEINPTFVSGTVKGIISIELGEKKEFVLVQYQEQGMAKLKLVELFATELLGIPRLESTDGSTYTYSLPFRTNGDIFENALIIPPGISKGTLDNILADISVEKENSKKLIPKPC